MYIKAYKENNCMINNEQLLKIIDSEINQIK